jgi:hypothetical protein
MNNRKFKLDRDFDFTISYEISKSKSYLRSGSDYKKIGYAAPRNGKTYFRIFKGYTWDGCSPKISFFDMFWIGTPDGCVYDGKQKLYYPSLIHDFLLQFRSNLSLTRKQCDDIFLYEMSKNKFTLRWLYYFSVRIYGVIKGK